MLCADQFTTLGALKIHLRNTCKHCKDKEMYKCDLCPKSYNHKRTLQEHMNIHTQQQIYKCSLCPKTFLKKAYLSYHSKVHQESKPFECTICTSSFRVKGKLTEHIKHVHEKKIQYSCPMCPKTFPHKFSLTLHTRRHVGAQACKCPHCPYLADGNKDLNKHLKHHNADGKYKCSECSASFDQRGHQRRHIRLVHKKDPGMLEPRIFKCSKCPREYKYLVSCQRHELTHNQVKDFQCLKCVAKFYTAAHLKRHMVVHVNATGEFVCRICKAYFSTHQTLSCHNKKWHGLDTTYKNQTFTCQYCMAVFNQKNLMIKHQRVHDTESNKYFCQPCDAKFISNLVLSSHNKRCHGEESP